MASSLVVQKAYLLEPIAAVQPPELETSDPSLATVILPAPPPLASVTSNRKDNHLKRHNIVSYLPSSDPGTTYSGLMGPGLGLNLVPSEDEGRLRKRARTERSGSTRPPRSSARNLNVSSSQGIISLATTEHPVDHKELTPSLRRTNSVSDEETPDVPTHTITTKSKTKDKGKGRERATVRVKEEPHGDLIEMNGHINEDHCSSCRSFGSLLYCDGCPRAFHLWCLDPPMDAHDVPEGDKRWYCPACIIKQKPPPKPRRASFMAPLLHQLSLSIPTEFELPEDIRNFFKDVSTGPKGTYQDVTEVKSLRTSRFNIPEERDPYRLKDKNGNPILCYRCKESTLPEKDKDSTARPKGRELRSRKSSQKEPAAEELWKSIASCDYCNLHWHLDCLDPPLAAMPPAYKKWMCPIHVDHVVPKRRVPKQPLPVTDITKRNVPNNGNIEIIPADKTEDKPEKMKVDEVHINGRRYRIPERVIVLDFWDKLAPKPVQRSSKNPSAIFSASPLTDLSSEERERELSEPPHLSLPSQAPQSTAEAQSEELDPVELLLACRNARLHSKDDQMDVDVPVKPQMVEMGVQTDPELPLQPYVMARRKRRKGMDSSIMRDQFENDLKDPSILPATRPRSNVLRPVVSNPTSPGSLRRLSSASAEPGSSRVTRSKAQPSSQPSTASKSPFINEDMVPQSLRSRTHTVQDVAQVPLRRVTRSSRSQTAVPEPSPAKVSPETTKNERPAPKSRQDGSQSPKAAPVPPAVKTETSNNPVIHGSANSPFKIRIPSAINTAVAAATAAAAASRHPKSQQDVLMEDSSDSESSLTTASSTPSVDVVRRLKGGQVSTNGNGNGVLLSQASSSRSSIS